MFTFMQIRATEIERMETTLMSLHLENPLIKTKDARTRPREEKRTHSIFFPEQANVITLRYLLISWMASFITGGISIED